MNGKIYKITNSVNNKKYIGLTKRDVETRFMEHHYKSTFLNSYLYYAMRKYGFEKFDIQILETGIKTMEQLNRREMHYIKKYDTFNNGYNLTLGGGGTTGDGKCVMQIDKNTGEVIGVYPSMKKASKETGANYRSISNVCNGLEKSCGGFIWVREDDYDNFQFKPYNNKRHDGVKVLQISKETNEVVNKYKTITAASKATGIILSGISECINGKQKTAGGYKWKRNI